MNEISNTISKIEELMTKNQSKLVDIFFWYFIISFFIDRVVNYFSHFPFFVGAAIVIFPFLFVATLYKNPNRVTIIVLVLSFVVITILNSIVYLFGVKNISDFLFIVLLVVIYFYYKNNISNLRISNVYVFLIMSLILFSFTFFGMDSASRGVKGYASSLSWINQYDEKPEQKKNVTSSTKSDQKSQQAQKTARENSRIKWEANPLDKIEGHRVHYNGMFRHPHMASYFFGFLFLFFAFQYQKIKNVLQAILLVLSLIICIYTGTKALLVAFVLTLLIFLFRKKYLIYLGILLGLLLILILTNSYFLQLTKDTVFYQYFSFFKTATANISRLSRYRLAYSWWIEVQEFGFFDFMIGKSYLNSMLANSKNLGMNVWFHNDFLSIFYTYGVWCTLLYIGFFVKVYHDNKQIIKRNLFIFVFYGSMIFAAIFNGFYYYFPVFILYVFLLMIKHQKQLVE